MGSGFAVDERSDLPVSSHEGRGMRSFDSNCMLGPTSTNSEPCLRSAQALLREMDRVGIEDALVFASQAVMAHPADGNPRVVAEIEGHPRLHACWVLLPPSTGELSDATTLVAHMKATGVRAARIFPARHKFPLIEPVLRPLLQALAAARIPLFIDVGRTSWWEISGWREIFEIAAKYPTLPVVLLREGGTTWRALFEVWDSLPNIHLDTSYLQESRIVEVIVDRFGHERLLFGTGMPAHDPGGPLSLLNGAQITPLERSAIAGGNLRHLLGLPQAEPFAESTRSIEADGFRVFDVHGHTGRFAEKFHADSSPQQTVERMDQVGIDILAVSDFLAVGPDYKAGNDRTGESVAAFPQRLLGYVVYNPNYESEMKRELDRGFEELGCSGIKLHCAYHETSTEDPAYRLAFEISQQRACPVLCHQFGDPSVEFLLQILADYPNTKFIYAHLGGKGRRVISPLLEVAAQRTNFFLDLSFSNMPRGGLAWLVDHVPSSQIVFGSDYPLNDFTFQLGRVLYSDISQTVKRAILHDNAARIFRA